MKTLRINNFMRQTRGEHSRSVGGKWNVCGMAYLNCIVIKELITHLKTF